MAAFIYEATRGKGSSVVTRARREREEVGGWYCGNGATEPESDSTKAGRWRQGSVCGFSGAVRSLHR
jgi:hypothetical protein